MAAIDMLAGDEHVVCVAGDAAFTCGVSFKKLSIISQRRRLILVLNDNEWSIAKNVGAVAEYLNRIVANPAFALARQSRAVRRMAGRKAGATFRPQGGSWGQEPAGAERDLRGPRRDVRPD